MLERPGGDGTMSPMEAVVDLLRPEYPAISQSSLRFLERAGRLTPTRTPGGHRLYVEADIQRIRQIKNWQAQRRSFDEIRQRLAALAAVRAARDLGVSLDVLFIDWGVTAIRLSDLDQIDGLARRLRNESQPHRRTKTTTALGSARRTATRLGTLSQKRCSLVSNPFGCASIPLRHAKHVHSGRIPADCTHVQRV